MKNLSLLLTIIFVSYQTQAAPSFQDYIGIWDGSCKSGVAGAFKLKLTVKPMKAKNQYTWTMNYYGAQKVPDIQRNYTREFDPQKPSQTWLDEGGGARFLERLEGNKIFGLLINQTVIIHSQSVIENGSMKFELNTYNSQLNEIYPQVGSYSPYPSQSCSLNKVK